MGYYLFHPPETRATVPPTDADPGVTALRARLENGTDAERREATLCLVALRAEKVLTDCLASSQPSVVQLASAGLWECWLSEKGPDARHRMEEGIDRMNAGDLPTASGIFTHLMTGYPDWAEAINKQATLCYLQNSPRESIALCHRVVALKPDHFGAWNGLALCAIQLEDWTLAFEAIHESLRLQPRSQMNQQLLRLVNTRLPQV